MKAIVLTVSKLRSSFHGGEYCRAVFLDLQTGGEKYLFDCYLNHHNSCKFYPYLKPQAIFDNLSITTNKKGIKFINGNSDFRYLGIKNTQKINA